MSIAETLKAVVAEANALDQRMARRIGEHIDTTARTLGELMDSTEAKLGAPQMFRQLPPAQFEQFDALNMTELKAIATRMKLPGRSKPGKRKATLIQFLIDNRAPLAPSYEQLLAFWISARQ